MTLHVENDDFPHTVDTSRAWMDSAMQFSRNEDFYRRIVVEIGEMFGDAAKTSDDGSIQQDVLALKVPELVRKSLPQTVTAWAVERWQDEVKNRPLQNIHRRTLDTTWRQVIRRFGGDPDQLVGPSHDALLDVEA